MAQPQGLNVPAIAVTGIVTVLLTALIVEGVRAYYNYEYAAEEGRKWDTVKVRTVDRLRDEQEKNLNDRTPLPIAEAMGRIAASGGKLPATRPAGAANG